MFFFSQKGEEYFDVEALHFAKFLSKHVFFVRWFFPFF